MRILFLSRAYGQHAGGMELLSYELIQAFPEQQKIINETKPGTSILSSRLQSIIFAIKILPKAIIASKHADVVHLGDPVLSLIGYCIARIRHIPIVVTVHGLDIAYPNPIYQLYLQLFFHSFAYYIAISNYAQKILQKHRVRGNISVIPPGITDEITNTQYTRNDLGRLLYRNIENKVVFATTGRLVTRKGHEWFIKHVLQKLPRTVLYVIAGSGPREKHIAALIRSLQLEERVIMLGRISHEQKKILLHTIDAFIQPNIAVPGDAEGFGIAPLEAALCGKMVFASNIDGIPSAIHHGKNGIVISPKETTAWITTLTRFVDEVSKYSSNTPNRSNSNPKGLNSREYTLATFNWKTIAEQYKKIFQATVQS